MGDKNDWPLFSEDGVYPCAAVGLRCATANGEEVNNSFLVWRYVYNDNGEDFYIVIFAYCYCGEIGDHDEYESFIGWEPSTRVSFKMLPCVRRVWTEEHGTSIMTEEAARKIGSWVDEYYGREDLINLDSNSINYLEETYGSSFVETVLEVGSLELIR